jgi:hypothetical protein
MEMEDAKVLERTLLILLKKLRIENSDSKMFGML